MKKPDDRAATVAEVGAALGLSGERVRQIEAEALRKARRECDRRGLALSDLVPDAPGGSEADWPETCADPE